MACWRRCIADACALLHGFHLVVVQYDEDTKEIESEILETKFHLLIGGCYEMKIKNQRSMVRR